LTHGIWVNSKALIGIFSQTAGSTCEFWANPVNFTCQVYVLEQADEADNANAIEVATGG
jgi:hypothetical protein